MPTAPDPAKRSSHTDSFIELATMLNKVSRKRSVLGRTCLGTAARRRPRYLPAIIRIIRFSALSRTAFGDSPKNSYEQYPRTKTLAVQTGKYRQIYRDPGLPDLFQQSEIRHWSGTSSRFSHRLRGSEVPPQELGPGEQLSPPGSYSFDLLNR